MTGEWWSPSPATQATQVTQAPSAPGPGGGPGGGSDVGRRATEAGAGAEAGAAGGGAAAVAAVAEAAERRVVTAGGSQWISLDRVEHGDAADSDLVEVDLGADLGAKGSKGTKGGMGAEQGVEKVDLSRHTNPLGSIL